MSQKLANVIKMWKGIGNSTTLLFSLNGLKKYMMILPEVKYAGSKLVQETNLGLDMNGTHQVLAYADDVNLM